MKRLAFGLVIGASLMAAVVFAQAGSGPARELTYQGILRQGPDAATGTFGMHFYLVTDPSNGLADAVWDEEQAAVDVQAGAFSVVFGQTTPLSADILSLSPLWVGVQVEGVDLAGKQPLRPVAYSLETNAVPAGTIISFAGNSVPDGWMICDGSVVSPVDFPRLFAAIGNTYGSSGGNFRLPDLRGRVPLGLDNQGGTSAGRVQAAAADQLGGAGGRERTTEVVAHAHTLNPDGQHDHTMPDSCNAGTQCSGVADGFVRGPRNTNVDFWIGDDGNHDHGGGTNSTGVGSVDNMPPYLGLRYLIKF